MGLGKTIQAIAPTGTSKEQLITNPHHSTLTIISFQPCLLTHWKSEIAKHAQAGALQDNTYHGPTSLPPSYSYICSQYTATHHVINNLLSSCQIFLTGTPIHNSIYDLLGIISFTTQPQSSDQDNWSPFILNSLSKGRNDILELALNFTKISHLKSLPTISHHYELLSLNPTIQKEYFTLYKKFLSSKTKGPQECFRSVNKLWIFCNHHTMINSMGEPNFKDHEGRSTPNNSTISQTIVDVETCIMSSKIAHLLKRLLKNQQSRCGPTRLVAYTQWTQFLDLIGIALAHHSFLSSPIDGKITAQAQEKPSKTSSIILNMKYSFHPLAQLELASK
ncbi:hypothetical protein O181_047195 [Austropuccinia psidii MF-1]|uniref:SNF2 N-terminal domain-containing protein n=1 Tax=Austropuccinia psidii MF-1 TaxID=1389203 RepID=A0A9Q3DPS5_9BASI|nr:hypothetical protein [Austropuccinia psidii MF-1]